MRFASVPILTLGLSAAANSVVLQAGDVLVARSEGEFQGSTIFHLDPSLQLLAAYTLPQTIALHGVTHDSGGQLLLAINPPYSADSVLRFDPATGESTVLSQGDRLSHLFGIATTNGDIFVTNQGEIVRIDPATGEQDPLQPRGLFLDLAATASGDLFTIKLPSLISIDRAELLRIDTASGEETEIAPNVGRAGNAGRGGIAIDQATGDVIVADRGNWRILRVNTVTGEIVVVSEGGLLRNHGGPSDVAVDPFGFILAVGLDQIVRIDPETAEQSLASSFGGLTIMIVPGEMPDGDDDGHPDRVDNCPDTPNTEQADADGNGVGDACNDSEDTDNDEWADTLDNCPIDANADQADADDNGVGDVCNNSEDLDGDEWSDALDNCPNDFNADQAEADGDGLGNVCDPYPLDTFNVQGLLDLDAARSTIAGLEGYLSTCESDGATCSIDLSQTQASLTVCNGDLSSCIGTATQLEADLAQSEADLSQAQSHIALLQADVVELESELASTEAELTQTQAALAEAVADTDEDGVRDTADTCPETAAGLEVDLVGCSQVQFCSGIDASTGQGIAICNTADWKGDEPLAGNAGDCMAHDGSCSAVTEG